MRQRHEPLAAEIGRLERRVSKLRLQLDTLLPNQCELNYIQETNEPDEPDEQNERAKQSRPLRDRFGELQGSLYFAKGATTIESAYPMYLDYLLTLEGDLDAMIFDALTTHSDKIRWE